MSSQAAKKEHFRTYHGVQVLRFIAAGLVMMTHATFYVSTRIDSNVNVWNCAIHGVSIFFVISGFVMAISSRSLGLKSSVLIFVFKVVWAVSSIGRATDS